MAVPDLKLRCSLKQCMEVSNVITESIPRVEVSTVIPPKMMLSDSKLVVNWSQKGEAVFHQNCWETLLKSSRSRNTKTSRNLKMINMEKHMVKEAAKTVEKHDGLNFMQREGKRIATMIKESAHCVAFTGAGISTSAGIGDYRGKSGKWTEDDRATVVLDCDDTPHQAKRQKTDETVKAEQDKKLSFKAIAGSDNASNNVSDNTSDDDEEAGVPYESLRPTYTHEALHKLLELGHLHYIISQNGDGLHLLSGVKADQISELHGNVFLEKCEKCCHVYHRPYYVMDDISSQYYEEIEDHGKSVVKKPKHATRCTLCGLAHQTGRKCSQKGCKGYLIDTIINFKDHLEDDILDRGIQHAQKSDLMLCLGTTLQVTPACDLVEMGQEPVRLIICNRQKTPFDSVCKEPDTKTAQPLGARVFGDCDILMKEVMKGILPKQALETWESKRHDRMQSYDRQRDQP